MMTGLSLGGCRFFQLGYVVTAIDPSVASFQGAMGASLVDLNRDVRDAQGREVMIQCLAHLAVGSVEIELIEPRAGHVSIYPMPSAGQEAALHHIGFQAADDAQWDEATRVLHASGAAAAMTVNLPRVRVVYYDTRARLGHYTEIVQRR